MARNQEEQAAAARKPETERKLAEIEADARGESAAIGALLGNDARLLHDTLRAYRNRG